MIPCNDNEDHHQDQQRLARLQFWRDMTVPEPEQREESSVRDAILSLPPDVRALMPDTDLKYYEQTNRAHVKAGGGGSKFTDPSIHTIVDVVVRVQDLAERVANRTDDREALLAAGASQSSFLPATRSPEMSATLPEALYYKVDGVEGRLGIIRLSDLDPDTPVFVQREKGFSDPTNLQRYTPTSITVITTNELPATNFATVIVGREPDPRHADDTVWTVHPGPPVRPSSYQESDWTSDLLSSAELGSDEQPPLRRMTVGELLERSELGPNDYVKIVQGDPTTIIGDRPVVDEATATAYTKERLALELEAQQLIQELTDKSTPPERREEIKVRKNQIGDALRGLETHDAYRPLAQIREAKKRRDEINSLLAQLPNQEDAEAIRSLMHLLPADRLDDKHEAKREAIKGLRGRLKKDVLGNKDSVAQLTAARGILFELSRMARLQRQSPEQLDFEVEIPKITQYAAMNGKTVVPEGRLDADVPMSRNGLPYIYEAKQFARMELGLSRKIKRGPDNKPLKDETGSIVFEPVLQRDDAKYDQLIAYQQAITNGQISGATYEMSGRFDSALIDWAKTSGRIPGVEILYTYELPSGAEYTFQLKKPEGRDGLRLKPEFAESDQAVVDAIERARADGTLIEKLTTIPDPANVSESLQPILNDPMNIRDLTLFYEYEAARKTAVEQALLTA